MTLHLLPVDISRFASLLAGLGLRLTAADPGMGVVGLKRLCWAAVSILTSRGPVGAKRTRLMS